MHGPSNTSGDLPGSGQLRQLRPSDRTRFRDHMLRLDAAARRDRFNGVTDDSFVVAYSDRCFRDGTTVVGYVVGETVRGAAELHELADLVEPTGEIAFSVERGFRHSGIGSQLFRRVIGHALALGYTKLHVTTHSANEAMKALARKFDARLSFEHGEAIGQIDLSGVRMSIVTEMPAGPVVHALI